jgi:hypothetical protein
MNIPRDPPDAGTTGGSDVSSSTIGAGGRSSVGAGVDGSDGGGIETTGDVGGTFGGPMAASPSA